MFSGLRNLERETTAFLERRTAFSLEGLKTSGWKIALGIALVLLAALISLVSVGMVFRWQESEQAWKKTQTDLEAKGETLTIDKFVPQPIPDGENFFADPLWMEMADREPKEKNGITYQGSRLPEEKRQLHVLRHPLSAEKRAALEKQFPEFAPLEEKKSSAQAAFAVWKEARGKDALERRRAADLMLAILEKDEPIMDRLQTLGKRPDALYPINYEDGVNMGLEHLTYLLATGQWLQAHALASLEIQQVTAAEQDILMILRLRKTLDREPIIVSKLVQGTLAETANLVINQGIKTHAWDKPQLMAFAKELASIDLLPPFTQALRVERASLTHGMERILLSGGGKTLNEVADTPDRKPLTPLVRWTNRWQYLGHDKAFYNNAIQKWVEALQNAPEQGLSGGQIRDVVPDLGRTPEERSRRLFSALTLPNLYRVISRITFLQSRIDQTRAACFLELYRLDFGAYPDDLTAIEKAGYGKIPPDLTTLKDLGYERKGESGFSLWSAGWNATDERGKTAKDRQDGDWVWSGEQK